MQERDSAGSQPTQHLTSEALAALLVDALVDAGIVRQSDLERAIAVVEEELEARKSVGDY